MEDFKLILYILAAIAFFLYNTWRKAFKDKDEVLPPDDELPKRKPAPQPQAPRPQPRSQPQPQHQPQRQAPPQRPEMPKRSFEEILKELQPKAERAKEQARPVVETVREKAAPAPKPAPAVARSYETIPERTLSLEEPEEAREARRRAQRKQLVTEPYSPWKAMERTNKYADMLRNKQTVRDAFILTEVFKRKYE